MIYEVCLFSEVNPEECSCFLAGGINNVKDWQKDVIKELKKLDSEHSTKVSKPNNIYIYNPREVNTSYKDKEISIPDCIKWDDKYMQRVNILSFYFCKDATQATSLFELGRYITLRKFGGYESRSYNFAYRHIISFEEGYPYADKAREYLKIIFGRDYDLAVHENATPQEHARMIFERSLELNR